MKRNILIGILSVLASACGGESNATDSDDSNLTADTNDEHIEKIRPYIEMGFRHLVFHAPGPDQERFLKLYGERVLPKLRRQFD